MKRDALALLAGLSGALAVAAGAFAAHGAGADAAALLRTGGTYQLVHAVATLAAIALRERRAGWLFTAGGAVFGGSLYALAFGAPKVMGAITPLGGVAMILGWLLIAWRGTR
ncbi:DUF423 domain-containing protein [Sphingomonas quercus]|uniref:DUF423 domain-containing protein n=1 Tax=Sphingomonas quercus TaxID=2842451 RepID=A0ABS6BFL9_9SPHN|nr:DUF423 domain-containing protein [Sphingomonas quercus]MBU3076372.1 DUF423 domain-containing protein [Sphingomonas quercus]